MTTTLAQQLQALHVRTTKGTWGRGETSHHIASNKGAGKHYRVAEFRHADDAEFCEFVHANMPAILEALGALEECTEVLQKLDSVKNVYPAARHFLAEVQAASRAVAALRGVDIPIRKPADKYAGILEMLKESANKRAELIANGVCPDCKGLGEVGGQFTGGERTCDLCNGTGKAATK